VAGVFAFLAHRSFTFGIAGNGGARRQAVRYFTLLALNIPLSGLALSALLWIIPTVIIAKFAADVISVSLTYWLSKRFVFLSGEVPPSFGADGRSQP